MSKKMVYVVIAGDSVASVHEFYSVAEVRAEQLRNWAREHMVYLKIEVVGRALE